MKKYIPIFYIKKETSNKYIYITTLDKIEKKNTKRIIIQLLKS